MKLLQSLSQHRTSIAGVGGNTGDVEVRDCHVAIATDVANPGRGSSSSLRKVLAISLKKGITRAEDGGEGVVGEKVEEALGPHWQESVNSPNEGSSP